MRMIATIGEKSISPAVGKTRRIGAIIGSVSWTRNREMGFCMPRSNQEISARAMIAYIMSVRSVDKMLKMKGNLGTSVRERT